MSDNKIEKLICKVTIWVYQYFYEKSLKRDITPDLITYRNAFDKAYDTVSTAGFVAASIEGNTLKVYMLNPAKLLAFSKTGEPVLFEYLKKKMIESFGLDIEISMFHLIDVKDGLEEVFQYTEPFLANQYDMIQDDLMSWRDAFELQ